MNPENLELLEEQALGIYSNIIRDVMYQNEVVKRQTRELEHAEDVVNWINQLDPDASSELLMAGWLHDFERLLDPYETTGYKGDRNSPEYLAHKKHHANRGANLAKHRLELEGWTKESVDRVHFLISHHDDTGEEIEGIDDPDLTTLAAADSFSFFTYIAPDMLEREGQERLQAKADFMVGKMSSTIRGLLTKVHLSDPIILQVKENALAKS